MRYSLLSALAVLALAGTSQAGFDSYNPEYMGDLSVKTGKKTGGMASDAAVVSSELGDAATFDVSGEGDRGIRANITVVLNADGSAALTVDCKVLADPRFLAKKGGNGKGSKGAKGKKVRVKYTANGTYTLGEDGYTVSLDVSNNRGKRGNNVTGVITKDTDENLSITLNSGFKEKLKGVGKRMSISYLGVPVPMT